MLDVDAHHGDVTQEIFYRRADVLTVSVHVDPNSYYPYYIGYADESGQGEGEGYNINIPLAPKANDATFHAAVDEAAERVRAFGAEALVVALGYDSYREDPIGLLDVSTEGFRGIGARIRAIGLPTVVVQEGGYQISVIGQCLGQFLNGLLEMRTLWRLGKIAAVRKETDNEPGTPVLHRRIVGFSSRKRHARSDKPSDRRGLCADRHGREGGRGQGRRPPQSTPSSRSRATTARSGSSSLKRVIATYRKYYGRYGRAISDEMGAPLGFAKDAQAAAGLGHLSEVLRVLKTSSSTKLSTIPLIIREPDRRLRPDHAVELADQPDRLQGRARRSRPAARWC